MKQINHYSKNRQSDFYTALHSVTQRYTALQLGTAFNFAYTFTTSNTYECSNDSQ